MFSCAGLESPVQGQATEIELEVQSIWKVSTIVDRCQCSCTRMLLLFDSLSCSFQLLHSVSWLFTSRLDRCFEKATARPLLIEMQRMQYQLPERTCFTLSDSFSDFLQTCFTSLSLVPTVAQCCAHFLNTKGWKKNFQALLASQLKRFARRPSPFHLCLWELIFHDV